MYSPFQATDLSSTLDEYIASISWLIDNNKICIYLHSIYRVQTYAGIEGEDGHLHHRFL